MSQTSSPKKIVGFPVYICYIFHELLIFYIAEYCSDCWNSARAGAMQNAIMHLQISFLSRKYFCCI